MSEQWKDIPGYKGYYQASDLGRIRSVPRIIVRSTGFLERRRGVIYRLYLSSSGYLSVNLSKHDIQKTWRVHQLVAMAFIPRFAASHRKTIDHIDRNRSNNKLSNLRWSKHSLNLYNREQVPMGKNLVRGVTYDKRYNNKWKVHCGQGPIVGRYATLEEAKLARRKAYLKAINQS